VADGRTGKPAGAGIRTSLSRVPVFGPPVTRGGGSAAGDTLTRASD